MVSGTPGLMDLLIKKMMYLNQAEAAHAQNVANSNTPGYKPLEVVPFSFEDAMKQASTTSMVTTNPRHIVTVSAEQSNPVAVRAKSKNAEDAADVEQESVKVSQTGIEYQMMTSIYHKVAGLFKIALKGSST